MGNREDLLAGAKRCLYEKGYGRTTARDIAAASGVSLAAIGYHFGSKEALLNTVLIQATEEWGDELERALAAETDPDAPALERFEAVWTRVIESLAAHRPLWAAQFEIFAQIDRVPEIREFLADAQQRGRLGLAAMLQDIDPTVEKDMAQAVGGFYHALLSGVLVQWLTDPQRAPSGHDL
ncbi:MAG: TetR/AcrR family transcriptional regulator, partial [Actinobacteria bacterium]|nr:TetR/AcrR family transcriptional regulator [Actinomycetota bacterium]